MSPPTKRDERHLFFGVDLPPDLRFRKAGGRPILTSLGPGEWRTASEHTEDTAMPGPPDHDAPTPSSQPEAEDRGRSATTVDYEHSVSLPKLLERVGGDTSGVYPRPRSLRQAGLRGTLPDSRGGRVWRPAARRPAELAPLRGGRGRLRVGRGRRRALFPVRPGRDLRPAGATGSSKSVDLRAVSRYRRHGDDLVRARRNPKVVITESLTGT